MKTTELITGLSAAEPHRWESIYAATTCRPVSALVLEAAHLTPELRSWLIVRSEAGPPGNPLPDSNAARATINRGGGERLDVYTAILGPGVATDETLLAALERGLAVDSYELVYAFGLVVSLGIVLRRKGVLVQEFLDRLKPWTVARSDPLGMVHCLRPVLSLDLVVDEPEVSRFLHQLCRDETLAIAAIPVPDVIEPTRSVVERLRAIGLGIFADRLELITRNRVLQRHLAHPVVRALLAGVHAGADRVDVEGPPPLGLAEWANDQRAQWPELARLTGLWLAEANEWPDKAMFLIMELPRLSDLTLLLSLLERTSTAERLSGWRDLIEEVLSVCADLTDDVADLLVVATIARNERRRTMAWVALEAYQSDLAALAPANGGLLAELLATQSGRLAARAADLADGTPMLARWADELEATWRRAGQPPVPDMALLDRFLHDNPAPRPLGPLVTAIEDDVAVRPPVIDLAVRYVLHCAAREDDFPAMARHMGRLATELIGEHVWRELYPWRVHILQELLDASETPAEIAEYLQRMGMTHIVLGNIESALTELDRSSVIAYRAGEWDLAAATRLRWADWTIPDLTGEEDDGGLEIVETRLTEFLPLDLAPAVRGELLLALARLESAKPNSPDTLVRQRELLDQALSLLKGAVRASALSHRSQVRRMLGERDGALSDADEALAICAEEPSPQSTSEAHRARAALALDASGRPTDATLMHLREALKALTNGNSPTGPVEWMRVDLGRHLAAAGQADEAAACFETAAHRAAAASSYRVEADACYARARLALSLGEARTALGWLGRLDERGRRVVGDDGVRTLHARAAVAVGQTVDVEAVLIAAPELAHSETVDEDLLELYRSRPEVHWPQPVHEAMLARMDARGWSLPPTRARVLSALGRNEEARAVLDEAWPRVGTALDRLAFATAMSRALPADDVEERARWIEIWARVIDSVQVDGHTHCDLAFALDRQGVATSSPELFRRARDRAARARQIGGDGVIERSLEAEAVARINLLISLMPVCDESTIGDARWFLENELPPSVWAHHIGRLLVVLLTPGPMVTAAALCIAEGLLARASDEEAQDRLDWIRLRRTGADAPIAEQAGPLDGVPGWLIGLAVDGSANPSAIGLADLDELPAVQCFRPDLTDGIVCALLDRADRETADNSERFVLSAVRLLELGDARHLDLPSIRRRVASGRGHPLIVAVLARLPGRGDAPLISGPIPLPDESGGISSEASPEVRFEHLRHRGVALIQAASQEGGPERAELARAAVEALDEALYLCRTVPELAPRLFAALVSAGNARRVGAPPDIDGALALYAEAEALIPFMGNLEAAQAQVDRCWAEALVVRDEPSDMPEAIRRAERSLAVRRDGTGRASTLFTLGRAVERHPGLSPIARASRAARALIEAMEHDGQVMPFVERALDALADWRAAAADDSEPRMWGSRLVALDPSLRPRVDEALEGLLQQSPRDGLAALLPAFFSPAVTAMIRETAPFERAGMHRVGEALEGAEAEKAMPGAGLVVRMRLGPIERRLPRNAHRHALARLAHVNRDSPEAAGLIVARVCILADWSRTSGGATLATILAAARDARELITPLADEPASLLLFRLGCIFTPRDHTDDPVRDFALGAELLELGFNRCNPDSMMALDCLGAWARATRYRTDGDIAKHRENARVLFLRYRDAAERARDAAHLRKAMENLGELERTISVADREQRREREIRVQREVLARSPSGRRPEAAAGLAWALVEHSLRKPTHVAVPLLEEADDLFARCDPRAFEVPGNLDLNHTVCRSELARRRRDHATDIKLWEEFIRRMAQVGDAYRKATGAHNLADAILWEHPTNWKGPAVARAFFLYEQAATVRTIEISPRQAWETAQDYSTKLLMALNHCEHALPDGTNVAAAKAFVFAGLAFVAGKALGPGREVLEAVDRLAETLALVPSAEPMEGATIDMEKVFEACIVGLLTQDHFARLETSTAMRMVWATAMAHFYPDPAPSQPQWLGTGSAVTVRWWCRLFAAMHRRRLVARQRPAAVPWSTWHGWRAALASGDAREVANHLERVRETDSTFLATSTMDWSASEAWLAERPSSAVVAIISTRSAHIALVVEWDGGSRRARIAYLPDRANGASSALTEAEARSRITGPLRELIGQIDHLVWCPMGPLREISAATIWNNASVVMATSPLLAPRRPRNRPRRALIVAADPHRDFKSRFRLEIGDLAEAAGPTTRCLVSQGSSHGQDLLTGAEPGPASPDAAVRFVAEHDLVIFVAHGRVDGASAASLRLATINGPADLDIERLATSTGLEGAVVILLSCETGQIGAWLHRPGGVAGALLEAGAVEVMAPMAKVSFRASLHLAQRVVRHYRSGAIDLADALLRARADDNGPTTAHYTIWTA